MLKVLPMCARVQGSIAADKCTTQSHHRVVHIRASSWRKCMPTDRMTRNQVPSHSISRHALPQAASTDVHDSVVRLSRARICSIRSPHARTHTLAAPSALVYIHEALHLRDKVQDAGYKALVEKWDSDSDSDASDDEADLMV